MMRSKILMASFGLLTALSGSAYAGGLALSEVDAKESGRASASAAEYEDPSAIFFNPANITRLPGLQLSVGVALIMPRWGFTPEGGGAQTLSNVSVSPPPNFSVTYNFGKIRRGDLAIGLGFYAPYGASFSWPTHWVGRDQVQSLSLQVFELSPTIAWRPIKQLSIGAAFRYMPASVYLQQAVSFGPAVDGQATVGGSANAFGGSAGISVWPMEALSLALTWRSASTLNVTGKGHFAFPPPFDTSADDGNAKTSIPLAQVFRLGAAYDIMHKLNVSADVEYEMWNTFKSLDLTLTDPAGVQTVVRNPRNSMNSFVVHIGAQYKINRSFEVRAGYAWDQLTLPENTVNPAPPDSDRHELTVGASYYISHFGIHAYFANAFFTSRETTTNALPGTWTGGWPNSTMAYLFGVNISASFDALNFHKSAFAEDLETPAPAAISTPSTEPSSTDTGAQQ